MLINQYNLNIKKNDKIKHRLNHKTIGLIIVKKRLLSNYGVSFKLCLWGINY